MIELRHGRARLALHRLRAAAGTPLLLLHELAASAAMWEPSAIEWSGPVYALDFCGHGHSTAIAGGGYTPELLAGDADAALAHIGGAVVAGAGIGAYVSLLLSAGRADDVAACLLLPGRGLTGGGAAPDFRKPKVEFMTTAQRMTGAGCDPMVAILEHDVRPPEYVARFAGNARRVVLREDGASRPPWWEALRTLPNAAVERGDLNECLRRLDANSPASG